MPLWPSVVRNDSQAVCCRKPPPSTLLPNTTVDPTLSAIRFRGFGHVSYDEQALPPLSGSLGVKLKFRTFAPDAVVLLLTSADSIISDYAGIYLNGGRLHLSVVYGAGSTALDSQQVYNTGDWYEVRTLMQLQLFSTVNTVLPWMAKVTDFCVTGLFSEDYFELDRVPQRPPLLIAEAGFFTGWMHFLSPNRQCQSKRLKWWIFIFIF